MLNKVKDVIDDLDGVLEVNKLTNEDILKIIDLEELRTRDVVPVFNRGVQESFQRDVSLVIFKKGFFRAPPSPTVMLTFDGEILGHDIFTKEDKLKYKDDEDVMFLSNDFIVFKDVLHNHNLEKGHEYFILPPVPFPELDNCSGIYDVISSSPSTHSDEYLKEVYGFDNDSSIATIIVSFNLKNIDS